MVNRDGIFGGQGKWKGSLVNASADLPLPPGPEWIYSQWERALYHAKLARAKQAGAKQGRDGGNGVLLVLDEVQKVMGWSEVVKDSEVIMGH